MKTSWTKGVEPESSKEIELQFKASVVVRRRLAELLQDKYAAADKSRLLKDGYDSPNWAFKQADVVGYHRALSEILSLLED
jgi:hypothetical protein